MNKIKHIIKCVSIILLNIFMIASIACSKKDKYDYSWTENRTIVHALGIVDDITMTNSFEAFQNSLQQGQTVFEVDLALTSDNELICAHDLGCVGADNLEADSLNEVSKEEFMSIKIQGKYTPLCMEDLILLMRDNPQIYIVTDTKADQPEEIGIQFNNIVELAKKNDCPQVLDRIIPQIYNEDMFFQLKTIYDWKSYIYTSYYTFDDQWDEDKFIDFAAENGIGVLTVFAGRGTDHLLEKANSLGLKVYVHTYNTEEERQAFMDRGFWGLYTDSLPPIQNDSN